MKPYRSLKTADAGHPGHETRTAEHAVRSLAEQLGAEVVVEHDR
jgi:hypothetical protein